MLARNVDVEGAVDAVRELEDRFNRNFNYPWVFLNDEPFSDEFKRCVVGPLSERCTLPLTPTKVACRMWSLGLHILVRFQKSIGTSRRGLMKPRQRRSEGR